MKALLFDTETTGLPFHDQAPLTDQPYIIEFGAMLVTPSGEVVDSINLLIKPPIPISEEITKITGITEADVANAPSFAAAFPQIATFFKQAGTAVAHNLPFDKRLMMFECRRNGIDPATFWPEFELCTGQSFRPLWGRMPKLTELYEWTFDKPLAQTHRALDDVTAMFEIFVAHELGDLL